MRLDHFEERLRSLATNSEALFLFAIETGEVRFDDKPGAPPIYTARAELYRDFLQQVIDCHAIGRSGLLALSLADRSGARPGLPVFEYQKQRGSPSILLPDVDLLGAAFFAGEAFRDPVPFAEKRAEAFFVGATSGGLLNRDTVRALAHPRLRAAAYFKDRPGVTFELPEIVQCDGPETEAMIRALGFGEVRRPWADHFRYRYLLSIDGNGANCSRVALGLMGQAVLAKYNSPFLLFYFHGLEPWRHYLPVRRDDDVLALVAGAAETIERDAEIAARSTEFARQHLTEAACLSYTAELLRLYLEAFGR